MLTPQITSPSRQAWRLLLSAAACLMLTQAQAQDSLRLRDNRLTARSDPWITGPNAAALSRLEAPSIAGAELLLTRAEGGLADYYQSDNTWEGTAAVEAVSRLTSRTVFAGEMSYSTFSGRNMAGSAFIDPRRRPFDIVEDSLCNTGSKHRDTYHLRGAVSMTIGKVNIDNPSSATSIGLCLDYNAANYAKYKDLRHKNLLMDLTATAGLYSPVTPWLAVGAAYSYHRNTESISFSTYGKGDRTFNSLISYAAFMGQVEQFGAEGYTDKSREMPLVSDENALTLQFGLTTLSNSHKAHEPHKTHTPTLSFYNSITLARLNGYYGRKSPYTATLADHTSKRLLYHACLQLALPSTRHRMDFTLASQTMENKAANYRTLQNDAGATYYEYYTPVKTANRLWTDGRIALTSDIGTHSPYTLPKWTIEAAYDWQYRRQTAYLYPYYRRQELTTRRLSAAVTRNLPTGKRTIWSLQAGAAYQKGSGDPFEDLTFAQPSDKQTPPAIMEAYLMREYQYLTAPQWAINAAAKYAFCPKGLPLKAHVSLAATHRKATETYEYSTGSHRTEMTLAVGCTF